MAIQTRTSLSDWLRIRFSERLIRSFWNQTVFLKLLRERAGKRTVEGDYSRFDLHTGRNTSSGARSEGNNLPPPGRQKIGKGTSYVANHWIAGGMSGDAIENAKRGGAGAGSMNKEMKEARNDIAHFVNKMLHGDGSAVLTACVSASSATVMIVDSVAGLEVGQEITVALVATGVVTDGTALGIIASIATATNTITLYATGADPDAIAVELGTFGSIDATYAVIALDSWSKVTYGLGAVMSTANPGFGKDPNGYLGSIDRTAAGNEFYKANVKTAGALRGLSFDLMEEAQDAMVLAGGQLTAVLTDFATYRAYGALLRRDRAFVEKLWDGKFPFLEWNKMPVFRDRDAAANTMDFLDLSTFEIHEQTPLGFMDSDGQILVRSGSGRTAKDEYEFRLHHRFNLVCTAPNRNTRLEMVFNDAPG